MQTGDYLYTNPTVKPSDWIESFFILLPYIKLLYVYVLLFEHSKPSKS